VDLSENVDHDPIPSRSWTDGGGTLANRCKVEGVALPENKTEVRIKGCRRGKVAYVHEEMIIRYQPKA